MNKSLTDSTQVIAKPYLIPFVFVGLLFPLWGFANDITNPMVAAFKNILLVSNFESALVQCAFYVDIVLWQSLPRFSSGDLIISRQF